MTGRTTVITGAAGGIGSAIARRLAPECANLVLVDRSTDLLTGLIAELSGSATRVRGIGVDLSQRSQLSGFFSEVEKSTDGVDILVNNAGVSLKLDGRTMKSWEITPSDWRMVMEVNLTAPFLLARYWLPGMKKRGWGRIINMASAGGRQGSKFASPSYGASKTALIGLSRRLAVEAGPFGVTVNCVAPGRIQTPLLRGKDEQQSTLQYLKRVPARRIGLPEDVANAVAFLASDAASYVVGATVDVNGGAFMG